MDSVGDAGEDAGANARGAETAADIRAHSSATAGDCPEAGTMADPGAHSLFTPFSDIGSAYTINNNTNNRNNNTDSNNKANSSNGLMPSAALTSGGANSDFPVRAGTNNTVAPIIAPTGANGSAAVGFQRSRRDANSVFVSGSDAASAVGSFTSASSSAGYAHGAGLPPGPTLISPPSTSSAQANGPVLHSTAATAGDGAGVKAYPLPPLPPAAAMVTAFPAVISAAYRAIEALVALPHSLAKTLANSTHGSPVNINNNNGVFYTGGVRSALDISQSDSDASAPATTTSAATSGSIAAANAVAAASATANAAVVSQRHELMRRLLLFVAAWALLQHPQTLPHQQAHSHPHTSSHNSHPHLHGSSHAHGPGHGPGRMTHSESDATAAAAAALSSGANAAGAAQSVLLVAPPKVFLCPYLNNNHAFNLGDSLSDHTAHGHSPPPPRFPCPLALAGIPHYHQAPVPVCTGDGDATPGGLCVGTSSSQSFPPAGSHIALVPPSHVPSSVSDSVVTTVNSNSGNNSTPTAPTTASTTTSAAAAAAAAAAVHSQVVWVPASLPPPLLAAAAHALSKADAKKRLRRQQEQKQQTPKVPGCECGRDGCDCTRTAASVTLTANKSANHSFSDTTPLNSYNGTAVSNAGALSRPSVISLVPIANSNTQGTPASTVSGTGVELCFGGHSTGLASQSLTSTANAHHASTSLAPGSGMHTGAVTSANAGANAVASDEVGWGSDLDNIDLATESEYDDDDDDFGDDDYEDDKNYDGIYDYDDDDETALATGYNNDADDDGADEADNDDEADARRSSKPGNRLVYNSPSNKNNGSNLNSFSSRNNSQRDDNDADDDDKSSTHYSYSQTNANNDISKKATSFLTPPAAKNKSRLSHQDNSDGESTSASASPSISDSAAGSRVASANVTESDASAMQQRHPNTNNVLSHAPNRSSTQFSPIVARGGSAANSRLPPPYPQSQQQQQQAQPLQQQLQPKISVRQSPGASPSQSLSLSQASPAQGLLPRSSPPRRSRRRQRRSRQLALLSQNLFFESPVPFTVPSTRSLTSTNANSISANAATSSSSGGVGMSAAAIAVALQRVPSVQLCHITGRVLPVLHPLVLPAVAAPASNANAAKLGSVSGTNDAARAAAAGASAAKAAAAAAAAAVTAAAATAEVNAATLALMSVLSSKKFGVCSCSSVSTASPGGAPRRGSNASSAMSVPDSAGMSPPSTSACGGSGSANQWSQLRLAIMPTIMATSTHTGSSAVSANTSARASGSASGSPQSPCSSQSPCGSPTCPSCVSSGTLPKDSGSQSLCGAQSQTQQLRLWAAIPYGTLPSTVPVRAPRLSASVKEAGGSTRVLEALFTSIDAAFTAVSPLAATAAVDAWNGATLGAGAVAAALEAVTDPHSLRRLLGELTAAGTVSGVKNVTFGHVMALVRTVVATLGAVPDSNATNAGSYCGVVRTPGSTPAFGPRMSPQIPPGKPRNSPGGPAFELDSEADNNFNVRNYYSTPPKPVAASVSSTNTTPTTAAAAKAAEAANAKLARAVVDCKTKVTVAVFTILDAFTRGITDAYAPHGSSSMISGSLKPTAPSPGLSHMRRSPLSFGDGHITSQTTPVVAAASALLLLPPAGLPVTAAFGSRLRLITSSLTLGDAAAATATAAMAASRKSLALAVREMDIGRVFRRCRRAARVLLAPPAQTQAHSNHSKAANTVGASAATGTISTGAATSAIPSHVYGIIGRSPMSSHFNTARTHHTNANAGAAPDTSPVRRGSLSTGPRKGVTVSINEDVDAVAAAATVGLLWPSLHTAVEATALTVSSAQRPGFSAAPVQPRMEQVAPSQGSLALTLSGFAKNPAAATTTLATKTTAPPTNNKTLVQTDNNAKTKDKGKAKGACKRKDQKAAMAMTTSNVLAPSQSAPVLDQYSYTQQYQQHNGAAPQSHTQLLSHSHTVALPVQQHTRSQRPRRFPPLPPLEPILAEARIEQGYFCSSFVAACYIAMGLLDGSKAEARRYMPYDFYLPDHSDDSDDSDDTGDGQNLRVNSASDGAANIRTLPSASDSVARSNAREGNLPVTVVTASPSAGAARSLSRSRSQRRRERELLHSFHSHMPWLRNAGLGPLIVCREGEAPVVHVRSPVNARMATSTPAHAVAMQHPPSTSLNSISLVQNPSQQLAFESLSQQQPRRSGLVVTGGVHVRDVSAPGAVDDDEDRIKANALSHTKSNPIEGVNENQDKAKQSAYSISGDATRTVDDNLLTYGNSGHDIGRERGGSIASLTLQVPGIAQNSVNRAQQQTSSEAVSAASSNQPTLPGSVSFIAARELLQSTSYLRSQSHAHLIFPPPAGAVAARGRVGVPSGSASRRQSALLVPPPHSTITPADAELTVAVYTPSISATVASSTSAANRSVQRTPLQYVQQRQFGSVAVTVVEEDNKKELWGEAYAYKRKPLANTASRNIGTTVINEGEEEITFTPYVPSPLEAQSPLSTTTTTTTTTVASAEGEGACAPVRRFYCCFRRPSGAKEEAKMQRARLRAKTKLRQALTLESIASNHTSPQINDSTSHGAAVGGSAVSGHHGSHTAPPTAASAPMADSDSASAGALGTQPGVDGTIDLTNDVVVAAAGLGAVIEGEHEGEQCDEEHECDSDCVTDDDDDVNVDCEDDIDDDEEHKLTSVPDVVPLPASSAVINNGDDFDDQEDGMFTPSPPMPKVSLLKQGTGVCGKATHYHRAVIKCQVNPFSPTTPPAMTLSQQRHSSGDGNNSAAANARPGVGGSPKLPIIHESSAKAPVGSAGAGVVRAPAPLIVTVPGTSPGVRGSTTLSATPKNGHSPANRSVGDSPFAPPQGQSNNVSVRTNTTEFLLDITGGGWHGGVARHAMLNGSSNNTTPSNANNPMLPDNQYYQRTHVHGVSLQAMEQARAAANAGKENTRVSAGLFGNAVAAGESILDVTVNPGDVSRVHDDRRVSPVHSQTRTVPQAATLSPGTNTDVADRGHSVPAEGCSAVSSSLQAPSTMTATPATTHDTPMKLNNARASINSNTSHRPTGASTARGPRSSHNGNDSDDEDASIAVPQLSVATSRETHMSNYHHNKSRDASFRAFDSTVVIADKTSLIVDVNAPAIAVPVIASVSRISPSHQQQLNERRQLQQQVQTDLQQSPPYVSIRQSPRPSMLLAGSRATPRGSPGPGGRSPNFDHQRPGSVARPGSAQHSEIGGYFMHSHVQQPQAQPSPSMLHAQLQTQAQALALAQAQAQAHVYAQQQMQQLHGPGAGNVSGRSSLNINPVIGAGPSPRSSVLCGSMFPHANVSQSTISPSNKHRVGHSRSSSLGAMAMSAKELAAFMYGPGGVYSHTAADYGPSTSPVVDLVSGHTAGGAMPPPHVMSTSPGFHAPSLTFNNANPTGSPILNGAMQLVAAHSPALDMASNGNVSNLRVYLADAEPESRPHSRKPSGTYSVVGGYAPNGPVSPSKSLVRTPQSQHQSLTLSSLPESNPDAMPSRTTATVAPLFFSPTDATAASVSETGQRASMQNATRGGPDASKPGHVVKGAWQ